MLLSSLGEANVRINFGDPRWTSRISRQDNAGNRRVVADPAGGRGQVLRVAYDRSTLYGTQFDYPAFSQAENPIQACLSYEVFFENMWARDFYILNPIITNLEGMVKVTKFLVASVGDVQSFFSTQLTGRMWERRPLS